MSSSYNIRTNVYIYMSLESRPQEKNCIISSTLLFLTLSSVVANHKTLLYLHGGQSRSWSAEKIKKEQKQVWQAYSKEHENNI